MDFMRFAEMLDLMEGTNFVTLVGRKGDSVT
jgi:hypothetical protein